MQIDNMNMRELAEFLKRENLSDEQRKAAEDRLRELSTKDFTPNPANKRIPTPKPRPTMEERGYQKAAHGGMIHRGRRAGNSAEKAR